MTITSLVFHRKDLCEGKHDAPVENFVSNLAVLLPYGIFGGEVVEKEKRSKTDFSILGNTASTRLLPHPRKHQRGEKRTFPFQVKRPVCFTFQWLHHVTIRSQH